MTASSISMDDEIKRNLTQLKKKIFKFIRIISLSTQVLLVPIANLFSMFRDEDLPSNKENK